MDESLSTTNLVKHYFNICNTALTQNRHAPVYGGLIALISGLVSGRSITVSVAGNDAETSSEPAYTVRFVDGEFTPVRRGVHHPDAEFTLDRSFLQDVVDNADAYIDAPERLDWSWLQAAL